MHLFARLNAPLNKEKDVSMKFRVNFVMLLFAVIGSALIGYATGSWAMGTGIALLAIVLRPWREIIDE